MFRLVSSQDGTWSILGNVGIVGRGRGNVANCGCRLPKNQLTGSQDGPSRASRSLPSQSTVNSLTEGPNRGARPRFEILWTPVVHGLSR